MPPGPVVVILLSQTLQLLAGRTTPPYSAAATTSVNPSHARLEPLVLAGLESLEDLTLRSFQLTRDGVDDFLQVLPTLQRLMHLSLAETLSAVPSSPAAYSGLTASSALKALTIERFTASSACLQHLLTPRR